MTEVDYKCAEINGVKYYGKHLLLTAVHCNERLLELDEINRFLKEMVPAIDMIAYGAPISARFGEGIEEGISAVQLITTSAIMIHTNDAARDMYLDVFSCKWFDEATVCDMLREFFSPDDVQFNIVLRR